MVNRYATSYALFDQSSDPINWGKKVTRAESTIDDLLIIVCYLYLDEGN